MKKLHDYVNAIFDIAHANDVAVDVAKDMFLTNIRNVGVEGATYYEGARTIHYDMLVEHLHELEASQGAYDAAVREHYQEIVQLRKEGKREEAVGLLLSFAPDTAAEE